MQTLAMCLLVAPIAADVFWYHESNGVPLSGEEAERSCYEKGQQLCTYDELCPYGEGHAPQGKPDYSSDWMPFMRYGSRRWIHGSCGVHEDNYGTSCYTWGCDTCSVECCNHGWCTTSGFDGCDSTEVAANSYSGSCKGTYACCADVEYVRASGSSRYKLSITDYYNNYCTGPTSRVLSGIEHVASPHTECWNVEHVWGDFSVSGEYCDHSGRTPYLTGKYYEQTDCTGYVWDYNHIADGATCIQHGDSSSVYHCYEADDSDDVGSDAGIIIAIVVPVVVLLLIGIGMAAFFMNKSQGPSAARGAQMQPGTVVVQPTVAVGQPVAASVATRTSQIEMNVQPALAATPAGSKFDPNTGAPIPKFDPHTGKQNW